MEERAAAVPLTPPTDDALGAEPESRASVALTKSEGRAEPYGPELFVGVVKPVGVDTDTLLRGITRAFERYQYKTEIIRITQNLLPPFQGTHEDERIKFYINACNKLCTDEGSGEAVIRQAVRSIIALRYPNGPNHEPKLFQRRVFVLSSIKRRAEVRLLRRLYGRTFYLISATTSDRERQSRLEQLMYSSRIASSEPADFKEQALELMEMDNHQDDELGQDVLGTYPLGDVFINFKGEPDLERQLNRFVGLMFGTPSALTDEEAGMLSAFTASLRSTSRSRQVGAALMRQAPNAEAQGSVVAMGANEIPQAGGGHPLDPLQVEKQYGTVDFNKARIRKLIGDVITRLANNDDIAGDNEAGSEGSDDSGHYAEGAILSPDVTAEANQDHEGLVTRLLQGPLLHAEINSLVEFYRAVHAEPSAILDAARRGVSTQGCRLFVTTYPCHLCAKEIVAAGIGEVIYREPYPKSIAQSMFREEIRTDDNGGPQPEKVSFRPFVGIAPRTLMDLVQMDKEVLARTDEFRVGHLAMPSLLPDPYEVTATLARELQLNES